MINPDFDRGLGDDQYQRFVELIYKNIGIWFEEAKKYYVEKRLRERMEILGIDSFRDYYFLLKFGTNAGELQELFNRLTVNETYFFRDFPQLAGFAEEVLPLIVRQKNMAGDKTFRIWSAGCSTGEEPYTLAIILREMLPDPTSWKIKISATDINSKVLDAARKGLYGSRSIKDMPPEYLERYFTQRQDFNLVNLSLKNMISFNKLNLSDAREMKEYQDYDVVFCRNVLIYFDTASRKQVVERFYRSLNGGGYIFLGHSESVGRITELFKMRRVGDHIVYHKP
jgi:chemotaxis protein methyltransferase CheR